MKKNNELEHSYLKHHGIKGMRWGIRRYQNPDGSYTDAGMKRYFNSDGTRTRAGQKVYDYRTSERYKKGTNQQRAGLKRQHDIAEKVLGRRAANKIDYQVIERGENRQKQQKREYIKQMLIGDAIITGILFVPPIANNISAKIRNGRDAVYQQNIIMNAYADSLGGLNEVKGGFTPGFKYVERGKKVAEAILKASGRR